MGFLSTLWQTRSKRSAFQGSDADFLAGNDGVGVETSSGVQVSRETALTISAVWRGVNLIARDVGKLPLVTYRRQGRGREPDTKHPAYALLRHKPNEAMTALTFRQTIMGHALLEGNGYAYVSRDESARPVELISLNPMSVTPVRANGTLWYVYRFQSGEQRRLPATDVLHVKGFSYDGLIGYNLVRKARESLGRAMAYETYGATFFRNNARPNMILQTPSRLSKEAARNLRESFERMSGGLSNAHRVAVLEEGLQAKEMNVSARDAQLIDQEKFSLVHVANWLNLPVHKVGGDGRTSYGSLEMENQAYLDDGLDPWLVTWEEECRDKLLTEEQKRKDTHEVRFERKQLLRANQAARGSYYVQALTNGWMTLDEVRDEEDLNPYPAQKGATAFLPLNMQPLDVGDPEADDEDEPPSTQQANGDPGAELLAVPDVRQVQTWDCGPAAALAVGQYFGVPDPADIAGWAELLGATAKDGTAPRQMAGAFLSLGLSVAAEAEMSLADVLAHFKARRPVLCPIQADAPSGAKGGHWVAVTGVGLGQVFVQDPAKGRQQIPADEFVARWHDADSDGNPYLRFGIAVGLSLEAPEPPQEATVQPPGPGQPAARPPRPGQPAPVKPAAGDAGRKHALTLLRSVLLDTARRMVKRLAIQAERAAPDHRKFGAWLESFAADNAEALRGAFAPAQRTLAALGVQDSADALLAEKVRAEFSALAERCTVKQLPGEAAALGARLVETLPGELADSLLARCGGPGSGVPGPCPLGGGSDDGKAASKAAEAHTAKAKEANKAADKANLKALGSGTPEDHKAAAQACKEAVAANNAAAQAHLDAAEKNKGKTGIFGESDHKLNARLHEMDAKSYAKMQKMHAKLAKRAERSNRCGGPGSGVPGPCAEGGEDDKGGDKTPEAAADRASQTYDQLDATAQEYDEQVEDALSGDDPDEAVKEIYEAHDEHAAAFEREADDAAKEAAQAVYDHYHPSGGEEVDPKDDPDLAQHVEDYEGDWSAHEEEYEAGMGEAKAEYLKALAGERDRAEQQALDKADKHEDATKWQPGSVRRALDAAAAKWIERADAAAAKLSANVAGVYGNAGRRSMRRTARLRAARKRRKAGKSEGVPPG